MAFLDETGLKTFKKSCDSHYVRLNGGSSTQTIKSTNQTQLGIQITNSNASVGVTQTSAIYGPSILMYDKDGKQCGEITHSFRNGTNAPSQIALYASNKMADGTTLNGGLTVMRQYNVKSDKDGTTYWFSSKPNVRTAIGIFSGTATPGTNTSRANGDIYIQY